MLLSKVLDKKTVGNIDIDYWKLKDNDEIIWSEAFLSRLGYSNVNEKIDLDFFLNNLIHKEDYNQFKNNFFAFVRNGNDFRQSILIKSQKGKYKEYVCNTRNNLSLELGTNSKFILFSKRKIKTSKKVKTYKFYFKETSEMTKTGNWYIDFLKQKTYWDHQTRRILEYPEDYIPSLKKALQYYPTEHHELARKAFLRSALDGKSFDIEIKMLTKNKREFWVRAMGKPVFNNNQEIIGLRGVFQDIDASKAKELDLLRTSNIIASQNKRLCNFAHIVSHNLRSHASNLTLITELLNSYKNPEDKLELMNNFTDIAKSLNDTIEHLNEVVTIQNSINKSKSSVNFNNMLSQVLISISQIVVNEKAKINCDFTRLESIEYIPAYLESILLNLITNAIKYKHPDRDPIINVTSYVENSKQILEISDNGLGIDLEKYGEKIFGMYNTFHYNKDAVGIGLFITKNQIEALRGEIKVESEVDQGTTFKIYF